MSKANRTRRVLLVALLACAAYALAQQGQQPQTRTIEFEPITRSTRVAVHFTVSVLRSRIS